MSEASMNVYEGLRALLNCSGLDAGGQLRALAVFSGDEAAIKHVALDDSDLLRAYLEFKKAADVLVLEMGNRLLGFGRGEV